MEWVEVVERVGLIDVTFNGHSVDRWRTSPTRRTLTINNFIVTKLS